MSAKLVRSASIYLVANILSAVIPFLLLPLLTRVLSPESYGLVAMFEAMVICLSAFTGVNITGAISVRFYNADRKTFPEYVSTCLLLLIITSFITFVCVLFFSNSLINITGLTLYWLLLAVVVASSQFIINTRLVIWQVSQKALRYGAFQVLKIFIDGGLSVVLVLTILRRAEGRMLGYSVALFLASLLAVVTLRTEKILLPRFNKKYAVQALRFGIPLIPHTLGGITVVFAGRFILKNQVGLDATGLYFAAVQLAAPLSLLGTSFNRAFTPWLYEKLSNKQNDSAVAASYLSMAFFMIIGALYIVSLYFLTPFFLGEKYQALKYIEPFLILGNVFHSMYFSVVNYIFYSGKTLGLSAITLSAGIIYIVVGWYMTEHFGIFGLAITHFGVQAITFMAVWLASVVVNRQPWFQFSSISAVILNWYSHMTPLGHRKRI